MGLAASQARALLLVARKSDLEYRSQCISQRKIVLSQQTEQLAKDYNNKISNRKLRFVYNLDGDSATSRYEDLSYYSLSAENPKFVGSYRVLNNRGDIVVASVNDIPKIEKKIYKYAYVTGDDSKDYKQEPSYTKSTIAFGEKESTTATKYPELFIQGYDENGNVVPVKVQGLDGPVSSATTYVKNEDGTLSKEPVEIMLKNSVTETDGTVTEKYSLKPDYSNAELYSVKYDNVYANADYDYTGTLAQTPGYKRIANEYITQKLDPVPQPDGSYISADGRKYIICADIAKDRYFQNGLRTGAFILQKENTVEETGDDGKPTGKEYTTWDTVPWQGIDVINDVLYTEDDALAESEYEAKTAVIKTQDQMLDLELKQIETQHKAIETEEESVKKVIQSNIEKTFKIFA